MPTIAHISDLHLQSGAPERQAQVEPILKKINAMKPDLVVISGDVTDDGWDSIDELKWAKDWLEERIARRWFAIPGNHDVGNFIDAKEGAITQERIDQWESVFSESESWDDDHWLVLGLNSMRLGMCPEAEDILFTEFIFQHSAAGDHHQHLALFLHSPLFATSPNKSNPAIGYWTGPTNSCNAFWEQKGKYHNVKLIGSGHVHQTRRTEVDGIKIAWAPPASGTWVHAPGLPNPPMPEQTGFFLHTLHDDGRVETELIECAPMLKLYEHNPWP